MALREKQSQSRRTVSKSFIRPRGASLDCLLRLANRDRLGNTSQVPCCGGKLHRHVLIREEASAKEDRSVACTVAGWCHLKEERHMASLSCTRSDGLNHKPDGKDLQDHQKGNYSESERKGLIQDRPDGKRRDSESSRRTCSIQ